MTKRSTAGIAVPEKQIERPVTVNSHEAEMDRKIRALYQRHGAGLAAFVELLQGQLRDSQAREQSSRVGTQRATQAGS